MASEAKSGAQGEYPARLMKWLIDDAAAGNIPIPPGILVCIIPGHIQGAAGPVGASIVIPDVIPGNWLFLQDCTGSPGRLDLGIYCPRGATITCAQPTVLLVGYIPMEAVASLG